MNNTKQPNRGKWAKKTMEAKQKRYDDIKKMSDDGYSMYHIAKVYELSRERIRQILRDK